MIEETSASGACKEYEVRLEDYLNGATDGELATHLSGCPNCKGAMDNARLAGSWMRRSWAPTGEPRSGLLENVMARIRVEKDRDESAAAFWNILEFLASRIALTAAVVLLAISAYLAGAASRPVTIVPTRTELTSADFPQPPTDPVSNEEVLQSLAESSYGH